MKKQQYMHISKPSYMASMNLTITKPKCQLAVVI